MCFRVHYEESEKATHIVGGVFVTRLPEKGPVSHIYDTHTHTHTSFYSVIKIERPSDRRAHGSNGCFYKKGGLMANEHRKSRSTSLVTEGRAPRATMRCPFPPGGRL